MQHVLVMNDSQEILNAIHMLLEEEGYRVTLASYLINDMGEITRLHPDLIIVDFMFESKNNGWNMIQLLKLYRETAGIPVIVCTAAYREIQDIESFLQAKGIALVRKPFDIDEFVLAVQKALTLPQRVLSMAEAHSFALADDRAAEE